MHRLSRPPCLRLAMLSPWRHVPARPIFLPKFSASMATQTGSVHPFNNEHISVGPDSHEYVDLSFAEEPLGVPASMGHGFAQLEFGEAIGPGQRYVIARKLGCGQNGSTWLARDSIDDQFVAIKILKGYTADLLFQGKILEREALHRLNSPSPYSAHCLQARAEFEWDGKAGDGKHMCFVTDVFGGDVASLRHVHGLDHKLGPLKRLPIPLGKRILLHLLRGIAHAHRCGVIHTDVKLDNVFFTTPYTTQDFERLLATDPSRRNPPEKSWDSVVQSAVSQPLPVPPIDEVATRSFVLADFGSAQLIDKRTTDLIAPIALRPPEIILQGPWDEKVDIWMFGCMVYEILTGENLFHFRPLHWEHFAHIDDPTVALFWQMLCYTNEDFLPEQLSVSRAAAEWFDSTCYLRAKPKLYSDMSYELLLSDFKLFAPEDIREISRFLRRCIRLDPQNRASAEDLLSDPWFDGVE